MAVTLETERLILREWKDEDLPHFARMNSDPIIMEYMPGTLSEEESNKLAGKFKAHFKKYGYGLFAVELKETGEFMGFVGLEHVPFKAHFTPAVEIAWRLDYGHWGHGYATEAALKVLNYAFTELKLEEVVAFSVYDNMKAINIMEKIGMKKVEGGDFDFPTLRKGHPLGRFVLYRMTREDYQAA